MSSEISAINSQSYIQYYTIKIGQDLTTIVDLPTQTLLLIVTKDIQGLVNLKDH